MKGRDAMCHHDSEIFVYIGMQEVTLEGDKEPLFNCGICNSSISQDIVQERVQLGHQTYILTELKSDEDGTVEEREGPQPPLKTILEPLLPKIL